MVARMPSPQRSGDIVLHRFGRFDAAAPTLVLLHGLTDSGHCWPDAARRWAGSYRVLAWDARGHGGSPRFDDPELVAGVGETHLGDALELLLALADEGVERPVLVGHSMGGGTAAAVAATRPDLVRGVLLEDPALGWPADDPPAGRARQAMAADRVAEARETRADPDRALRRCRAENPDWPEVEYRPWLEAKLQTDERVLADEVVTVRTPRLEVAAAVATPALVVTGDGDVIIEGELLERLRTPRYAHLAVEVVRGANHSVRRGRPDAFHAVADPWLAALLR